jgi:succinate dehydrogenase hydrophobic anchor subunit
MKHTENSGIDQDAEKGLTAIIVFSLAFCFLIMMVAKNTSNPELSYWLIMMPIWVVPALVLVCFVVWMFVDGMKALIQALSRG